MKKGTSIANPEYDSSLTELPLIRRNEVKETATDLLLYVILLIGALACSSSYPWNVLQSLSALACNGLMTSFPCRCSLSIWVQHERLIMIA